MEASQVGRYQFVLDAAEEEMRERRELLALLREIRDLLREQRDADAARRG